VAEFFEAAAAEKQQRIEIQGNAVASCDRSMARRAITNLLSNAVRYAPRDSLIQVRLHANAEQAQLVVENAAALHSPEELHRLFVRFARGAERPPATVDGAGLGLSIVESIMRLHGGSVTADSGAYGLRFTLAFPLQHTFAA
jgi:two-component system heavy metal sensor histidine kinase CusS